MRALVAALFLVCLAGPSCDATRVRLGGAAPGEEDVLVVPGNSGFAGGLDVVCETVTHTATLRPAVLAFALDVSGSMGQLDCPFWHHDPAVKWAPVVDAVKAFFERPDAAVLHASMTLFPASESQCNVASYAVPDVPLTQLPSPRFGEVLADYEAEVGLADYTDPMPIFGGTWRGGTPTAAALTAVTASLDVARATFPDASMAVVLVTDGMPAGCGDDIEHLASVIDAVSDLRVTGIVTYVIGVREPTLAEDAVAPWEADGDRVWACKNPSGAWRWNYMDTATPRPPTDNLANLHTIAAAGGTERAVLVDTGNPAATEAALVTAIDVIRRRAVPCSVEIPGREGGGFDPEKLDLRIADGGDEVGLGYDPTCSDGIGWRYDDPNAPTRIELCDATCRTVQGSLEIELEVDYLCTPRSATPT